MRKELKSLARDLDAALAARPAPEPVSDGAPASAPRQAAPKAAVPSPLATGGAAASHGNGHLVRIEVAPKVKCDLLAYTGMHCGGQMQIVRVSASGNFKGEIDGDAFQSLMIAGPYGTRITLATGSGEDWQDHPWRSIVLTKGHGFIARTGKPAVRIPNLDTLDKPTARRADTEFEVSYEFAPALDQGKAWTYGRPGTIRNKVRQVFIDKV